MNDIWNTYLFTNLDYFPCWSSCFVLPTWNAFWMATPPCCPCYFIHEWMNSRSDISGWGRRGSLSFFFFLLLILPTPSNSELSCRHMSESCIHLHSFVFCSPPYRARSGGHAKANVQLYTAEPEKRPQREKRLPVRARPSLSQADRLLMETVLVELH